MMMKIDEMLIRFEELLGRWGRIRAVFDVSSLVSEKSALEEKIASPDAWRDAEETQKAAKKLKEIEKTLFAVTHTEKRIEDIKAFFDLLREEYDDALGEELIKELGNLENDILDWERKVFLSDEFDNSNAILSIHPGAGGTESQDWAYMLLRMYMRWAEDKGFGVKVLEYQEAEDAGIKSATILIEGEYAYGLLKGENGVHRLVRISPFDASKRRHTSFASVEVIPEISEDVEVEIKEEDLKIDTFRASGRGGQYVNTTDSAVRIVHIPTGIVVSCQNERSQYQNRMTALRILKSKLYELERRKKMEELEKLKGEKREIAWGSQIRSYVFHPYTLVKDHRTGFEVTNALKVIDGDIDPFIDAYLRWIALGGKKVVP
ncbi:MAG: peptide chain release factor 2 [Synergistetes bacterium]|nr:peptide chain release factor 2 [Synergistota bacterium]MCX8127163.1 peptide chain release factor 2 [Synergistota bacterium]MDW8191951.1 peptide chain release factor 2 [Synergistota bacterium]